MGNNTKNHYVKKCDCPAEKLEDCQSEPKKKGIKPDFMEIAKAVMEAAKKAAGLEEDGALKSNNNYEFNFKITNVNDQHIAGCSCTCMGIPATKTEQGLDITDPNPKLDIIT